MIVIVCDSFLVIFIGWVVIMSSHGYRKVFRTVKSLLNGLSQKDRKLVFKTNDRLIHVKSIAEMLQGEHSALLLTFI